MARARQIPARSPVKCDFPSYDCRTHFGRRYDMLRHKREYHRSSRQCPHPECDYTTKRLERMTKHISNEHTVALNVPLPQALTSHQVILSDQQIQHQVPSHLGSLAPSPVAGYCTVPPGNTVTSGGSNIAQSSVQTILDAPTIATFGTSELSNYFSEAAQQDLLNLETVQADQNLLSSITNCGDEIFPCGNYIMQDQSATTDLISSPISSETPAFSFQEAFSSQSWLS